MKKPVEPINLTSGPITKPLLRFSIPMVLSMLTTQLYSIADTMIVGLKLDANALAAVSNATTLLMFFLFISGGMELGASILVAANRPVYNRSQLSRLTYNLLFVDVVSALLMLGLGLVLFRPLLTLINTPEEIISLALSYGTVYLLGLPCMMVYDLSRQVMIGYGNSAVPMRFVLVTSAANIVLDFILVDIWGVAGAAAASALAQVMGCAGVLLWLNRHILVGRFSLRLICRDYLRDMVRLVPPNILQQLTGPIITSIRQSLLGTIGVAAIAGFSCANKITTFMLVPVYASSSALVTFIAQNRALDQQDRIRQGIRASYKILVALTAVLVVLCLVFHHALLSMFTTDSRVIAYGTIILRWEPFTHLPAVLRHVNEARLRGHQKMLAYLYSSVSSIAVNGIAAWILVPILGFWGFVAATCISCCFTILNTTILVRVSKV